MRHKGLISGALLGALAWGLAASPALACSIMPPPPPPMPAPGASQADVEAVNLAWSQAYTAKRVAEDQAWRANRQAANFDKAKGILIVRFDRQIVAGKGDDARTLSVLKPVRWVQGQGKSTELQLGMTEPPPCGQMIAHAAYYGKPGDVFVVFLSDTVVRQSDVVEAYAIDKIVEPRTLAALMALPQ